MRRVETGPRNADLGSPTRWKACPEHARSDGSAPQSPLRDTGQPGCPLLRTDFSAKALPAPACARLDISDVV